MVKPFLLFFNMDSLPGSDFAFTNAQLQQALTDAMRNLAGSQHTVQLTGVMFANNLDDLLVQLSVLNRRPEIVNAEFPRAKAFEPFEPRGHDESDVADVAARHFKHELEVAKYKTEIDQLKAELESVKTALTTEQVESAAHQAGKVDAQQGLTAAKVEIQQLKTRLAAINSQRSIMANTVSGYHWVTYNLDRIAQYYAAEKAMQALLAPEGLVDLVEGEMFTIIHTICQRAKEGASADETAGLIRKLLPNLPGSALDRAPPDGRSWLSMVLETDVLPVGTTRGDVLAFLQSALYSPSAPLWLSASRPDLHDPAHMRVARSGQDLGIAYAELSQRFQDTQNRLMNEIQTLRTAHVRLRGLVHTRNSCLTTLLRMATPEALGRTSEENGISLNALLDLPRVS